MYACPPARGARLDASTEKAHARPPVRGAPPQTVTNAGNELGGFPTFQAMQLANKTGPFVLQQGGYRTGLFGK